MSPTTRSIRRSVCRGGLGHLASSRVWSPLVADEGLGSCREHQPRAGPHRLDDRGHSLDGQLGVVDGPSELPMKSSIEQPASHPNSVGDGGEPCIGILAEPFSRSADTGTSTAATIDAACARTRSDPRSHPTSRTSRRDRCWSSPKPGSPVMRAAWPSPRPGRTGCATCDTGAGGRPLIDTV